MQSSGASRGGGASSDYGSPSYWDERYAFLSSIAATGGSTSTSNGTSNGTGGGAVELSNNDMAAYEWYLDYASVSSAIYYCSLVV